MSPIQRPYLLTRIINHLEYIASLGNFNMPM